MGSTDEQFCLRWNDFQQCIKSTFQDLRDENEFMDVTISCDGEQLKAHKVILSACSVTFKTLLKKNPATNPVIVLWDVTPRDLSAILDFMYHGEVNVKQDHLNSFLAVAERLRVRGLCQNENSSGTSERSKLSTNSEKVKSNVKETFEEPLHKKPRVGTSFSQPNDDDEIEEVPVAVKQEISDPPIIPPPIRRAPSSIAPSQPPGVQHFATPSQPQDDYQIAESAQYDESMQGSDFGDYSGYEDEMTYAEGGMMDQSQAKGPNCRICPACFKSYSNQTNLNIHMKTVHENCKVTAVNCQFCGNVFKNDSSLRNHVYKYHRENKIL